MFEGPVVSVMSYPALEKQNIVQADTWDAPADTNEQLTALNNHQTTV